MGIFDLIGKNPLDKEIAKYEKLSADKPDNASLKNILGDLYFKKGVTDKAAKNYKDTIDLFLRARQNDKTIATLKKAISYDLLDSNTMDNFLDILFYRGLKNEVISLYIQYAKKKLNTSRPAANDIFRKVLEIDPDNEDAISFFDQGKQSQEDVTEKAAITEEIKDMETEVKTAEDNIIPEAIKTDVPALEDVSQEISGQKTLEEVDEGKKIHIRVAEKSARPFIEAKEEDETTATLKDKFIAIAKEKNNLEAILLQQNDIIKKLEKEKSDLSINLKRLAENNKKLKDKLLDFDILRNMEISDLKKKIETLVSENKGLSHEKEVPSRQVSTQNQQEIAALQKKKQELEKLLNIANEELLNKDSTVNNLLLEKNNFEGTKNQLLADNESLKNKIVSIEENNSELQDLLKNSKNEVNEGKANLMQALSRIQMVEDELSEAASKHREFEDERNSLKKQLDSAAEQFAKEKSAQDEVLKQEIASHQEEISELKTDIEDLTHAMEAKIHENDSLKEDIALLQKQMKNKETELNEKIPVLRSNINRLSDIVDYKLEEHSLFAKELSDLNDRIVSLNNEILEKDTLLEEIAEDYKKEIEGLMAVNSEHELEKNKLELENRELKSGIEEAKEKSSDYQNTIQSLKSENSLLEGQYSEALKKIRDLEGFLPEIKEKDLLIAELKMEHDNLISSLKAEIEGLSDVNNKHLHEIGAKDQFIAEITKEKHAETDTLSKKIENLEKENLILLTENKTKEKAIIELEDKYRSEISALREEIQAVRDDYSRKESVSGTKEDSIASIRNEYVSEIKALTEQLENLGNISNTYASEIASRDHLIAELRENHGLEISELLKKMEILKDDIKKYSSEMELKDRLISDIKQDLHIEVAKLVKEIEALKADSKEFSDNVQAKEQTVKLLSEENSNLQKMLQESETGLRKLLNDKDNEIAGFRQELTSHAMTISELKKNLEDSINDNIVLRRKLEERHEAVSEVIHKEETPAYVPQPETEYKAEEKIIFQEKKFRLSYVFYPLLFLIIIASAMFMYKKYDLRKPIQKSSQSAVIDNKLSYNDIFERLTRSGNIQNITLQATMITPFLLQRDMAKKDLNQYDFSKYAYFRVAMNSSKGPLDSRLIKDPFAYVKMIFGALKISSEKEITKKETKTFYRREEPISISFLCAFPKDRVMTDAKELKLVISLNEKETGLAWDVSDLRAQKIVD